MVTISNVVTNVAEYDNGWHEQQLHELYAWCHGISSAIDN